MITESEKQKLKDITEAQEIVTTILENAMEGEMPPEIKAAIGGTTLAFLDSLFAIREGTEWRGHTDPKEIAREMLRSSGVGED